MVEATLFLLRRANLLTPSAMPEQLPSEMLETAEDIVSALHFFPLSVDQAGAMIEDIKCRVVEYRDMYRQHRSELLQFVESYAYRNSDEAFSITRIL